MQLVVVFEPYAEAQLTKRGMASAWNFIRTELRPVNPVVETIIRTEDETGLQPVGCYLPLGYVTQQLRLEGSRQERKMVERRNDTRRQVGKALESRKAKNVDLLGCEWTYGIDVRGVGFH